MRDIALVEQVQKEFTKRLRGYRDILVSYAERLKRLNLYTLKVRRLKIELIYCYKIMFVRVNSDDFLEMATFRCRGHLFKFYRQFNIRSSF